jgi:hypothetical protein
MVWEKENVIIVTKPLNSSDICPHGRNDRDPACLPIV